MSTPDILSGLPGEDLVRQGLQDIGTGRHTIPACLVAIAQPRLRAVGFDAIPGRYAADAELQLYRLLRHADPDGYSSYNALMRQLISFEQALDHRCSRGCNDKLGTGVWPRAVERLKSPAK